jgi:nitrite reductase/ring-hydroxylating ferredoxin subunit
VIQPGSAPVSRGPVWHDLNPADEPPAEALRAVSVGGTTLVVANVEGTLLAYRDVCAGCSEPLHDGELVSGALSCAHCGRAFFLPRAGRSIDGDRLQLEPVPLLREQGRAKVALAA